MCLFGFRLETLQLSNYNFYLTNVTEIKEEIEKNKTKHQHLFV